MSTPDFPSFSVYNTSGGKAGLCLRIIISYFAPDEKGSFLSVFSLIQRDIGLPDGQRFIRRPDDPAAREELFDPVSAPAGHTGHGKQRRKQVGIDAERPVNQAGIHIHIGTQRFIVALQAGEYPGVSRSTDSKAGTRRHTPFLGEIPGVPLEYDRPGIG